MVDELNVHDIEIERTVVVEIMDKEEDVDTSVNRIYTNRQRQKKIDMK